MKTKATPGLLQSTSTESNNGLDMDMANEDIDPATGKDMDDVMPNAIELLPSRSNNTTTGVHQGDMGRLSVLESTPSIFRE